MIPYIPVMATERFKASGSDIGILNAVNGLVSTVANPLWGFVSHRTKRIMLLFALSQIAVAFSWLAMSLSTNMPQLFVVQGMQSFVAALGSVCSLVVLSLVTEVTTRGSVNAVLFTAWGIGGFIAAPLSGWLIDLFGYEASGILASILGAISTLPLLTLKVDVKSISHVHRSFDFVNRDYVQFLIAIGTWTFLWSMAWPLFPLSQVRIFNLSKSTIGYLVMVGGLVGILSRIPLGRLCDRLGRRPILLISPILLSALPLGYALAPTVEWLFIATVITNVGFSAYLVSSNTYLLDVTEGEERLAYSMAMYNIVVGITSSIGPLAGGVLSDYLGLEQALLLAAFARALGSLIFMILPETLRRA